MKNTALLVGLCLLLSFQAKGQLPSSNLWLLELSGLNSAPRVLRATKLTDNPRYTNQPHFNEKKSQLLYTQGFMDEVEQTDVMAYMLDRKFHRRVTDSSTSQYSPTPIWGGLGFSVIDVDVASKQWLVAYSNDGKPQKKLVDVEPIGYHVWVDSTHVLAFVLGEPHTLQLLGLDKSAQVIDEYIGPSLWPIPGTRQFSYTKNPSPETQPWTLMSVDPTTQETGALVTLPTGAYYTAWASNGLALTAIDHRIMSWDSHGSQSQWHLWLDVSDFCLGKVTRMHLTDDGGLLAFVCDE